MLQKTLILIIYELLKSIMRIITPPLEELELLWLATGTMF